MTKPDEPAECICGNTTPEVHFSGLTFWVKCRGVCWRGPTSYNRATAINAWNAVMLAALNEPGKGGE